MVKESEKPQDWYSEYVDTYTCEQRKDWYSEIAGAYNKTRPRYPQQLINRVVELAELPSNANILEIGCGPAIATVPFAELGFAMLCLEPSQPACQLARQNCATYPSVEIRNKTFEEWELEAEKFNAVLAATSLHWVSPEIRYQKTAAALKDKGALILLWNAGVWPQDEIYRVLHEVYQNQAPSLAEYHAKERANQAESIKQIGQTVIDSGLYENLIYEQLVSQITYSIEDYLALLKTYSVYIALDAEKRNYLLEDLRESLEKNCGNNIKASYLSAFHLAKKL
ncbi:MAG: class I SAM-dependent methyltransferase [Microcoleus sp. PH2017_10_PVI_O_A]|uniref:class I SAM-dependent methyltransferase n=1 Tax=unclassified Microcoleus TaxID=2642155 RepID=UPI001DB7A77E|nr:MULTISPECIES: class I SAM-dependent methyltransferase [unclassified Microcoleus]TAE81929.1 MAG: class I SAM-dependent methyltransferase [Oscillatoriales cyanobacterium]MCC3409018.1 class I SAM-dependent methyltransferase [Microcoleus sp. PH2017_10_PVI_O_A]MCC3463127.1 class I SAM-dependent methyltransferase [Microcoleus sp. PH2017_11_PCY_U_A]MCC3481542.1 class I SAM-dependent methyltransferase [Microcoleus sp. PH2017_12_PCY_D_A]MCC3530009.1 class I SAM-dependent methyltransferase [Microcole